MQGKTFVELQNEVGRYVGRPGSQYKTKLQEWINDAVQDYTRQFATPWTRRRRRFLSNGNQSFGCPQDVDMPVWFLNVTDKVAVEPGIQWDRSYPQAMSGKTQGTPWEWAPDGIQPVCEQPGTDVYLTVESVSGVSGNVYVQGEISDSNSSGLASEFYQVQATVYSTEGSTLTLSQLFTTITGISRDDNEDGVTIIRRADNGKAIAVIERGERVPRYIWARFMYAPATGKVFEMEYIPKAPKLLQDQDPLPLEVDSSYVKWHAAEIACRDMGMGDKAQYAARKAEEAILEERQKQLNFGDNIWQAMPYDDQWGLEGVD